MPGDIGTFITTHKDLCSGIVMSALGIFLIMGSLLRWRWLMELGGNEYRNMGLISAALYQKFGSEYLRIRNILIGLLLTGLGILFLYLSTKQ